MRERKKLFPSPALRERVAEGRVRARRAATRAATVVPSPCSLRERSLSRNAGEGKGAAHA